MGRDRAVRQPPTPARCLAPPSSVAGYSLSSIAPARSALLAVLLAVLAGLLVKLCFSTVPDMQLCFSPFSPKS
ncbi:hypothetical protein PIB30_045366 [Stylosanthes scabra]|uniref:Uncharacterized protein n=1 Tax=Stylosanthes scabra TaxID=79078 RepID=A0ABU6SGV8_9FABA|nr:hypothetical protein [Stylosanthes scabra]